MTLKVQHKIWFFFSNKIFKCLCHSCDDFIWICCSNTTPSIPTNIQRSTPQPAQPQKFVIVTQRPATPQPTTPTSVLPSALSGAIKYPNPTTINTINLPQNIQVQKVQQNPKIVIVNPPNSQQQAQLSVVIFKLVNRSTIGLHFTIFFLFADTNWKFTTHFRWTTTRSCTAWTWWFIAFGVV